jgi:asparagine synthase (glutamine-hydrolysing)
MCGWIGLWEYGSKNSAALSSLAQRMADCLAHRGPDDAGVWVDDQAGLALGFRRLAILDLSPEGHQPMESASGRYVIAFNGEVYNFGALRQELESLHYSFRGHSDTEVMLAAIEEWGLQAAVGRFVGMFAFALWDRENHTLSLVRDRLGIKPLYYGWMGQSFLCGSELKALRIHPDFRPEINRQALALYMRYSYIPAPYSIYHGIYKLPPGTILTMTSSPADRPSPVAYWSAHEVAEQGVANPFNGSDEEAVDQLESVLRESVKLRMIADVPLGAFLSGGIDSSTVVALMQDQSRQPIKTFTIGFNEATFNEAVYARDMATHLGTEHTELYATPEQALAVIPCLPEMYDEPFSDPSQIPTFLVSQLTRRHVTVSLSGDGGDELFAGYNNYSTTDALWNKLHWMPPAMRGGLAAKLSSGSIPAYAGRLGLRGLTRDKLYKLSQLMAAPTAEALYHGLISHWKNPGEVVIAAHEPKTIHADPSRWPALPDLTHRLMYLDTVTYLPDDILTKVDRASMAVSLEARVPLLDHRVVEFAWRLPLSLKKRDGQGKWILRQVLYRHVPKHLVERPKMGFGVPIGAWLRGPLREWAESLLQEIRLQKEGFFKPEPIRTIWREHLSGQHDWSSLLWTILMFQAWLERWGENSIAQH